jgi:hypothetical protein
MEIDARQDKGPPEADLANLYGGLDETAGPSPLLIEPSEDDPGEDRDSALDDQILLGLMRMAL